LQQLVQINRNIMFANQEACPELCKSIVAISDLLCVSRDTEVEFEKPIVVHLPIPLDDATSDCELVLFQWRPGGELEVIPKRSAVMCRSTNHCYSFQVDRLCR
jgi:hypothetical protein